MLNPPDGLGFLKRHPSARSSSPSQEPSACTARTLRLFDHSMGSPVPNNPRTTSVRDRFTPRKTFAQPPYSLLGTDDSCTGLESRLHLRSAWTSKAGVMASHTWPASAHVHSIRRYHFEHAVRGLKMRVRYTCPLSNTQIHGGAGQMKRLSGVKMTFLTAYRQSAPVLNWGSTLTMDGSKCRWDEVQSSMPWSGVMLKRCKRADAV